MLYYQLEKKLYVIDAFTGVVKFFCSWNQMWLSTEVSAKTLKDKGTKLL